jgi:uncharacterized lipoprotein YddW (UPF0748 family)
MGTTHLLRGILGVAAAAGIITATGCAWWCNCGQGMGEPPTVHRGREAEARMLWVTRWDYKTPEDVRAIVANAASLNFNVILFQVRGNGTVFYPSAIEPWA